MRRPRRRRIQSATVETPAPEAGVSASERAGCQMVVREWAPGTSAWQCKPCQIDTVDEATMKLERNRKCGRANESGRQAG